MPLRLDQGIPIRPPTMPQPNTNVAPDISFNINESDLTFAQPPSSLQVPMFWQKKSNWCWAACIQMIMAYYGTHLNQCQVAHVFLPSNDCCNKPWTCNKGCDPEDVREILRQGPLEVRCLRQDHPVPSEMIRSEIVEGRPLAAAIMWYTHDGEKSGGHLILIKGWRFLNDRFYVRVNDPAYGRGDVPYSKLRSYYGPDDDELDGVWEHTWTNIRKE